MPACSEGESRLSLVSFLFYMATRALYGHLTVSFSSFYMTFFSFVKDANLRIRLIRFYQRAGRIKEGFDHALQVSTYCLPHTISVGDPWHFGADTDPHL
jgi:hypothetical protein